MSTLKRTVTIITPQDLVHVRHTMSLMQYKIWLVLMMEYRDQVLIGRAPATIGGFRIIRFASLKERFGYEPKKGDFKEDLRALLATRLSANVLSKDGRPEQYGASLLSEFVLSSNRVAFKLPSLVEEMIEDVHYRGAMFQALNWDVFNAFSGKYEAIIYKLCKDYVGVRRTPKIPINTIREYLGLNLNEYAGFKKLNQKILGQAVDAINQSTSCDISIKMEVVKEGQRVAMLAFVVKSRSKKQPPATPAPDIAATTYMGGRLILNMEVSPAPDVPLVLKLGSAARGAPKPDVPFSQDLKHRFTQTMLDKALAPLMAALDDAESELDDCFAAASVLIEAAARKQYRALWDDASIALCIERANTYAAEAATRTGKPVNMGGLYRKAITDGWHQSLQQRKKQQQAATASANVDAVATAATQQAKNDEELRARNDIDSALADFAALPDDNKKALRAAFRSSLGSSSLVKVFDRSLENAAMLRGQFASFVRQSSGTHIHKNC